MPNLIGTGGGGLRGGGGGGLRGIGGGSSGAGGGGGGGALILIPLLMGVSFVARSGCNHFATSSSEPHFETPIYYKPSNKANNDYYQHKTEPGNYPPGETEKSSEDPLKDVKEEAAKKALEKLLEKDSSENSSKHGY